MNILLVPFLLQMAIDPSSDKHHIIIHATPLSRECANLVPEWDTTQGKLQVLDPYTVSLTPAGSGEYYVWANIPDTFCGGFIEFEVE